VVFLADAVDPVRGIGEPTVDETMLKELATAQGRRVVVRADASKFRGEPPPAWTMFPGLWSVITDSGVDEETLDAFAENRIGVTVA
jgi:DeoR/GlpR family transcriptional regulator of sugar metabolism